MIKRGTTTGAYAAFAGMIVVGALGGCLAAGAPSQFAPSATQQSVVAHQAVRGAVKIATGSIFIGYGAGQKSYIEMYANESDKWAKIGTITDQVATPAAMRVGAKGELYVADYASNAVSTYIDGKYAGSVTSSLSAPYGLALNSDSDLAVLNRTVSSQGSSPRITFFPFGTGGYPCVVLKGLHDPRDAAYEGRNLWVADYGASALLMYTQCDPNVIHTITSGVDLPVAVLIDPYLGDLWAANAGSNNVSAYTYSGPVETVSTGDLKPSALAAHGADIYIAAHGGLNHKSEVIDYHLKDRTQTEITDGVNVPSALAWCEPNLCVMNAFSVTIYDSSGKLVKTIKVKQTPISLTAVP